MTWEGKEEKKKRRSLVHQDWPFSMEKILGKLTVPFS